MFELSRDYERAWQLMQQGDRLACWVDYVGCRDIASARINRSLNLDVGARGIGYIYLFEDQIQDSNMFVKQCERLNIEFYLPLPDDTIVISPEDLEAIATKVIEEKVGKPLDNLIALTKGAL